MPPNLACLNNIRVVLMHTSHPGNIGSSARAMKNMGLSHLVLVQPKHFPDPQADALASGANDILENAQVVHSLEEALADCHFAVALTARWREFSLPFSDARQAAATLTSATQAGKVALVFGTEMSGLENADILRCQHICHIPTNPDYSSLNLAQAVQLLAYEIRMAAGLGLAERPFAPAEKAQIAEIEYFYTHLEKTLIEIGFLNPDAPRRLMPRLRRLFGRAGLEKMEVDILRGILTKVDQINKTAN